MRRRTRIVSLVLISWFVLAWGAAKALVVYEPLPHADAIVILSGSSTFRERADKTAKLFHQGRFARIILTNDNLQGEWSSAQQRNPYYYERARDELLRLGVPADKISVILTPVNGTHDEATRVRDFAATHDIHSILLVTSAYHSRRALWTFKKAFASSTVLIGVDPVEPGNQSPPASVWWLYPKGWGMVAGEYVKFVYYKLSYG